MSRKTKKAAAKAKPSTPLLLMPPEPETAADLERLERCSALTGLPVGEARRVNTDRRAARGRQLLAGIERARALLRNSGDPYHAPRERWQRGAEAEIEETEGGVRVQRASTGLAQLRRSGVIGDAEVAAAIRWRRDYELGVHGARDPAASGSGSGGVTMWMAARVDISTRYRQACQAVGMLGDMLLRQYVAEGLSLREMARQIVAARRGAEGPSEVRTRLRLSEQLADTLRTLAEHYAAVDAVSARGLWPRREAQPREGAPA